MIGETVANSLSGSAPQNVGGGVSASSMSKKTVVSPEAAAAAGCRPGVVTIVDVQNVVDPQVSASVVMFMGLLTFSSLNLCFPLACTSQAFQHVRMI